MNEPRKKKEGFVPFHHEMRSFETREKESISRSLFGFSYSLCSHPLFQGLQETKLLFAFPFPTKDMVIVQRIA